jgi:hypothetical protein
VNTIPEELDRAVRAVADHIPAGRLSLPEITARGRRLRRRRTATVCSVAAVAILAGAVGVPTMLRRADARPAPQPAASTTASASPSPTVSASPRTWTTAAQRLLLNQSSGSVIHADGSTAGINGSTGFVELLPSGKLRTLKTPKYNADIDLIPLPGGGAVLLGSDVSQPGQFPDGPNITGLRIELAVQRPDGSIASKRNVRIQGEYVDLLTADEQTAVLWRKRGVYLHDLATGQEQKLAGATALAGGNVDQNTAPTRVAAMSAQGRTIAVTQGTICPVIKIGGWNTGAARTLALPDSPARCAVGEMRYSPDGDALAVAYSPRIESKQVRLAVYDTGSGALVSDNELYTAADPLAMLEPGSPELRGIAWLDSRTVRTAVTLLPPGAKKNYRYQDLLRLIDIQVR